MEFHCNFKRQGEQQQDTEQATELFFLCTHLSIALLILGASFLVNLVAPYLKQEAALARFRNVSRSEENVLSSISVLPSDAELRTVGQLLLVAVGVHEKIDKTLPTRVSAQKEQTQPPAHHTIHTHQLNSLRVACTSFDRGKKLSYLSILFLPSGIDTNMMGSNKESIPKMHPGLKMGCKVTLLVKVLKINSVFQLSTKLYGME